MSKPEWELNERVLPNDYPMHPSFLYVYVLDDGTTQINRANFECTVGQLIGKRYVDEGINKVITSIKNCDIFGRNLEHLMV